MTSELEMEMHESQNQRDKRVEELWQKLDPQGQGELDFKGLQKGLQRIDHRERAQPRPRGVACALLTGGLAMKNAGDMLKEIIKVVDTNGDGKIQYDGASDASRTVSRSTG